MPDDRGKGAFKRLVMWCIGRRLDHLALYPSTVVKVAGMRVELVPDDTRLTTYQDVPIVLGLPGVTVQVQEGARVLLGFAAGDPQKPQAWLWESGALVELKLQATTIRLNTSGGADVNRAGDFVNGPGTGSAWDTWLAAVATVTGTAAGYAAAKVTPIGTTGAGASGVKA